MNIPVRHATRGNEARHRRLRHPSGVPQAGGPLPVPADAMARAHDHVRRAFAQGLSGQLAWPRMTASGLRVDAFPEEGPPGSDLELMRRQHLDPNGVEVGMLMQLSKGGMEERNLEFAAALSHAINEWQLETFVKPEPRLRAGIVVPQEDAAFAVRRSSTARPTARLRRSSSRRGRATRSVTGATGRSSRRRSAATLPIALHVQGFSGGHASTASGWPTYYMEEHYAATTGMQTH